MSKEKHLIAVLIEECSEVQKEACKMLRFGIDDSYEGAHSDGESNKSRLNDEVNDLIGIIKYLQLIGIIDNSVFNNTEAHSKKIEKINKYIQYSHEKGEVELNN